MKKSQEVPSSAQLQRQVDESTMTQPYRQHKRETMQPPSMMVVDLRLLQGCNAEAAEVWGTTEVESVRKVLELCGWLRDM